MDETPSQRPKLRLRIRGLVQGVGYRDWMIAAASRLELNGWVRNCRDGSVEVVVEGPSGAVQALVEAARRGPRAARVIAVDVEVATDPDIGRGFTRRPTI